MEISAKHKNARMAPRKLALVREVVRGLPVAEAQAQLKFMSGKASDIVGKVLNSAIANAVHNNELTSDELVVRDLVVNAGFTMKRFNPVSRGMAHPIIKRTSHVTVVLGTTSDVKKGKSAKGTKAKGKKEAANIETISAAEHIKREAQVVTDEAKADTPEADTGLSQATASKSEIATSKIKSAQQGGDQGKTHRRKSMSEK
ncbi:50S ribosomal protein L22 [bacterium]|nr:50S ribosomal protein L22 [bacterium]